MVSRRTTHASIIIVVQANRIVAVADFILVVNSSQRSLIRPVFGTAFLICYILLYFACSVHEGGKMGGVESRRRRKR